MNDLLLIGTLLTIVVLHWLLERKPGRGSCLWLPELGLEPARREDARRAPRGPWTP